MIDYDVIIIGAGAAGLMCGIESGKRGRKTLILDHSTKPAEKIRISGGGRCNFTNIHTSPKNFLSNNPHFCKSALSRYTPQDFITLVESHGIAYHEKKLGQLFCDHSAMDIISMLLNECTNNNVIVQLETSIHDITKLDNIYTIQTSKGEYTCQSLVVATGGLSIPKIGATPFGYSLAKQFGHTIIPTRAGLVPLTFNNQLLDMCKNLSGLSAEASINFKDTSFAEGLLFTHRGLSGPSILQISSYWDEMNPININLVPDNNIFEFLKDKKQSNPKQEIENILSEILPKRLIQSLCDMVEVHGRIADLSFDKLLKISDALNYWSVIPNGTEGYRTAEVTLGGVNTTEISSKTMESNLSKGLYFIGEVMDVTGHLGGFNFQWAWASGWVAGQNV